MAARQVSDLIVLAGRVLVMSTDELLVKNMTVVAAAQFTEPLFTVLQLNIDLRLQDLYLERVPGSNGGHVLDVENAGSSTTIDGGVFIHGSRRTSAHLRPMRRAYGRSPA